MSKLINNEGATKATLSILSNLKEAEDLKIKKRVLSEGYGKATIVEGEDCEDREEVTEDVDHNAEQTDSTLEECPITGDGNVPDGAIDPVKEGEEMTEEEKVCEGCGKKESECICKKEGEDCEDKIEERVCEGLEIVNIKGNTVLLKESNGYIVGKNYDKETGLIESAEEYKTEKVATKAFKRLSEKAE